MAFTGNWILSLSIVLRLLGFGGSLVLLYRVRDRRFAFLALMLLLMAARQILAGYQVTTAMSELPGLVVSVLAVALIYYFLEYAREEERLRTTLEEHNEELRTHRNKLRATFRASPDYIFVFDDDCRYQEILSGRDRITIRDPDEFIGRTAGEILTDDAAEAVREAVAETLRTRETQVVEYRLPVGGGNAWYEGRTAVIDYPEEGNDRVLFTARDVTERKERERQLQVLDRVLRHNVRNGMTVIQGSASIIGDQTPGDATAAAAETIRQRSETLVGIVEKEREIVELILDSPPVEPRNVAEIVEQRVAELAETHPSADIDVTLPESATALGVPNVGRAVEELVENAVVHADDGSPTVEVRVEKRADTVTIRVEDDGPGIPEQERAVLLEGHEIDPLYHGSGMGLWLVRWIVRLSEGSLTFEETGDSGSAVQITLQRGRRDGSDRSTRPTVRGD